MIHVIAVTDFAISISSALIISSFYVTCIKCWKEPLVEEFFLSDLTDHQSRPRWTVTYTVLSFPDQLDLRVVLPVHRERFLDTALYEDTQRI